MRICNTHHEERQVIPTVATRHTFCLNQINYTVSPHQVSNWVPYLILLPGVQLQRRSNKIYDFIKYINHSSGQLLGIFLFCSSLKLYSFLWLELLILQHPVLSSFLNTISSFIPRKEVIRKSTIQFMVNQTLFNTNNCMEKWISTMLAVVSAS